MASTGWDRRNISRSSFAQGSGHTFDDEESIAKGPTGVVRFSLGPPQVADGGVVRISRNP
jgi:hypothetical protein